jgi:dTDP-4-amino-4,6-dideoxygalactose transaminase
MFSSFLHDKIVRQFEENFAEYVGAKYAVSFNSATSAIFLAFQKRKVYNSVRIPSIIPPVVANALLNAGCEIRFIDKVRWVGDSYRLDENFIDSAQKVERDQFKNEADENDLMLFSFYPTKPVGSCDGGMIVGNDYDKIEELRELSFNGMSQEANNWERKINRIGHKMYMNSIQAMIANTNLSRLEEKKEKLYEVRRAYNQAFDLRNTSDHLYRINVKDNKDFVAKAKEAGIVCGIHYDALHLNPLYANGLSLPLSEKEAQTTVSIPFHEALTKEEVQTVINFVNENNS